VDSVGEKTTRVFALMTMKEYVIKKLVILILSFFLITIIIFALANLAPRHMPTGGIPRPLITPEMKEEIRKELGLDQPLHIQYLIWLDKLLHGNLGHSYVASSSIANMIKVRLLPTIELMLTAEIISITIAITLGAFATHKQYSRYDAMASLGALIGYSTPEFWLASILILVFALWLGWMPTGGVQTGGIIFTSPFHALLDHLKHLLLPTLSLVLVWTAYLFRIVRSSMLDVLTQDYIVTARSKGLKETVIIYKHALRNALLTIVRQVGHSIGFLFGSVAVVETIFAWPGLGALIVKSADFRDYPALMGISVFIATVVLIANFVSDIAYVALDPRIRFDRRRDDSWTVAFDDSNFVEKGEIIGYDTLDLRPSRT